MSLLQVIILGRKYLTLWPEHIELQQYFSEYHAVAISRFVCRFSLHFAVLILVLPFAANATEYLSQSIASSIFIASMPIQAYIILGIQADKFLPPGLATWYKEGVARMNEQGGNIKLSSNKPKYFDLVELLNLSYKR